MKAIVHEGKPGMAGLSLREMEVGQPGPGEVRVRLKTAGMNHRDLFVLHRHKQADPPLIIGSDGAGIVDAVGESVENVNIGDEVIINPGLGWKEKAMPRLMGSRLSDFLTTEHLQSILSFRLKMRYPDLNI